MSATDINNSGDSGNSGNLSDRGNNPSIRPDLIVDLTRDEGLRLAPYMDCCSKPYRDCTCSTNGKLTIGIGRNLDDNGIREDEAVYMLENDIVQCEREAMRTFWWFRHLSAVRQDAILNMLFNLGLPTLLTFKKFLAAMSEGRHSDASHEALDSKWAKQVGNRADRIAYMILVNRRRKED